MMTKIPKPFLWYKSPKEAFCALFREVLLNVKKKITAVRQHYLLPPS